MQVTSRRRIYWAILVIVLVLGWLSYWSTPPSTQLASLATLGILLMVNVGSVVVILYSRPKTKPDLPQLSIARKNDEAMAAILGGVGIMTFAISYAYRLLQSPPIYLGILGILDSLVIISLVRRGRKRPSSGLTQRPPKD